MRSAVRSGNTARDSRTGAFEFGRPIGWTDHYGLGAQPLGQVVDAQTLADGGIDGRTTQTPDLIGGKGTAPGLPSLRIFVVPNVPVALDVVRGRLAQFYANAQGNVLGRTDLTGCLAGSPSLGFELTYGAGRSYYQEVLASRGGTLYILEWVATSASPEADVLAEIVRTWQWLSEAAVATTQPTALAGGSTPNPSVSLKPGQTPKPTPIDLGPYLKAEISIANYGTQTFTVEVTYIDESSGDSTSVIKDTFAQLDATTEKVPEGIYRLTFTRGSSAAGVCKVVVKAGDTYGFGVVDDEIVVGSNRADPKTRADLVVPTSPLCVK